MTVRDVISADFYRNLIPRPQYDSIYFFVLEKKNLYTKDGGPCKMMHCNPFYQESVQSVQEWHMKGPTR